MMPGVGYLASEGLQIGAQMKRKSYRLSASTLAVIYSAGQRLPVTIPAGAVVTIEGNEGQIGLVEVEWGGRVVTIFAEDLHERGELVRSVSS